jgi:hypothetical protein
VAGYTSSAGTDIAAYDDLPGYHLLAARRLIATDDESYHGSDSELPPATLHGYAEWDFSDVPDPGMFRRFLDAMDYWFVYSDASSIEDYGPARERSTFGVGDLIDGVYAMGPDDGEDPRTRDESCSDQERTRSATRMGGSSPMHGTSNINDRFTLE